MTPAQLLHMIESSGGVLEVLADGRLYGQRVPLELHDSVKANKPALIALLQERERAFQYQPRTAAQWTARMAQGQAVTPLQSYRNPYSIPLACKLRVILIRISQEAEERRLLLALETTQSEPAAPVPCTVEEETESENDDPDEDARASSKVTLATLCVCGHRRESHCLETRVHFPGSSQVDFFTCLFEHCEASTHPPGTNRLEPCECPGFRVSPAAQPKLKRPKADDFTLCASCSHPKIWHCRAQREPKIPKLKLGARSLSAEQKPKGFFVGTEPFICSHFDREQNPVFYRCTSAACACADDAGQFCPCRKFVNPWLRKKAATKRSKKAGKVPFVTGAAQPPEIRP
jgi:hypothetical protein